VFIYFTAILKISSLPNFTRVIKQKRMEWVKKEERRRI